MAKGKRPIDSNMLRTIFDGLWDLSCERSKVTFDAESSLFRSQFHSLGMTMQPIMLLTKFLFGSVLL